VLPSRFCRDRFRAALRQTLDGEDSLPRRVGAAATDAALPILSGQVPGGPTKCSPKGERYKCLAKGGRYYAKPSTARTPPLQLAAALDGKTEPKRFG